MLTYKSTNTAAKIYYSTASEKYLPAKLMAGNVMASGYDTVTERNESVRLLTDYSRGITRLRMLGKTEQSGTPSADSPAALADCPGRAELYGKNLFDMETVLPQQGFVKQEDGSFYRETVSSLGGQSLWENTGGYTGQIKVLYRFKYLKSSTEAVAIGAFLGIKYTDGTKDGVYLSTVTWDGGVWMEPSAAYVTSKADKTVERVYWTYGTGNNSTWVKDIIITRDTSVSEYYPYTEVKTAQPVQALRSVGNVCDSVDVSGGTVKTVRRIGTVTLNGSETWSIQGSGSNANGIISFMRKISEETAQASTPVSAAATHFQNKPVGISRADTEGIFVQRGKDGTVVFVRMLASRTADLAAFKPWLAENNVTVNYVLAEPEVTDITQTDAGQALLGMNTEYGVEKTLTVSGGTAEVTQCRRNVCAAVARYGVRFGGAANSGATVQRLYNACGLTANTGTDTETAVNDFDGIYPWCGRKRCCGYWDGNGVFVVNAYEDEPGYTADGSNGEVWVETPLFYYKHTYGDDGSEEIVITSQPLRGFEPSPIHINADGSISQKAYTAAYPMAVVNNKPTSRSGVYTPAVSLNTGMANARLMGENYTTATAAEQYAKCLLMWVEFATRDIQSKMRGCSSLAYSADHKAAAAEESTNRVIISKSHAAAYVVGQGIAIGTALGSTNVANNRTVTAITDYDSANAAVSFDGDPVNTAVGNVVFSIAWKTGSCDSVLTSSGSPVSNTSGKYTCIYRGEETPFGNAFEWICDILFKREGSGTDGDPYSYGIYYLQDPTQYSNGQLTENYTKLSFKLPQGGGFVKKLGFDSRFPWLRIPCELGASANTYYADYYYSPNPKVAVAAAVVGGYWDYGGYCGPCCWYCYSAPSAANVFRRARLSYKK